MGFLSSVVKVHPWFGGIQTHFEGAALYAFSQAELLLRESVKLENDNCPQTNYYTLVYSLSPAPQNASIDPPSRLNV